MELELPMSLQELQEKYSELVYTPFELNLGGKQIRIVIADDTDLYLVYQTQAQVLFGTKNMQQGGMVGRILYHILELWPTSVLEVRDTKAFTRSALKEFMESVVEFADLKPRQLEKASEFFNSLKVDHDDQ